MSEYPSMSMAADKDHLILLHRKEIDRLKAQLAEARKASEPAPCPDCKGGESYRDCPACEGTGLASDTPLTDAAFEKADNNNSPQFGEGWEGFADSIKLDMQNLERQLADLKRDFASVVRSRIDPCSRRHEHERTERC